MPKRDVLERFTEKIQYPDDEDGCWLWTGSRTPNGYGKFYMDGRLQLAHRVAFVLIGGNEIPEGLQLDHLCRVRRCVRPVHLDPVSHAENLRRGDNRNREKTHCANGHEFTEANTYSYESHGWAMRRCRQCNLDAVQRLRVRKMEKL